MDRSDKCIGPCECCYCKLSGSLGTEYDNETNKKRFAAFQLNFQHGTGPTAGRVWLLYLLYATDGTNYEDGGTSVQPRKMPACSFPVRNVTSAQVVTIPIVAISPFKFKPLVWNDTDQNSSSSAVSLKMEVFDEEVQ